MVYLPEVDSLEIKVIIDNELDPFSVPAPNTVKVIGGSFVQLSTFQALEHDDRGDAQTEFRMGDMCCSAHGLSIMVTATRGDTKKTVLFDTGPEEEAWERNATRLGADISQIDTIVLSHWHRDHSGGMLKAIDMIKRAKQTKSVPDEVTVDLHPARPDNRGFRIGGKIVSMEADPSFQEITEHGGKLELNGEPHTVLDDMFLISGEIPRETSYEDGIKIGMRYNKAQNEWTSDTLISDERFLMCNLKGKGLVLFTGCSHAGVVNSSRFGRKLIDEDDSNGKEKIPFHAIVGGYHLSTYNAAVVEATVNDLKALEPTIMMPGHCTGWRAKYSIERAMPGRLVPCTVGTSYAF